MLELEGASDRIRRWREKPSDMVRELFGVEPDVWQADALDSFPHNPRMAMKACAGPGKTACLAWIGWNFLLTRPFPMIGATSISGANLKSALWAELSRWREKSPLLKAMFEQTQSAIFARDHPDTWRMEARTWPKDADATQIGNALAGLHAKYVMWLADETGDYPESIMPVMEGIFNGMPEEAHIVQAGNPTRLEGPLYRACTVARTLWKVIEITADPDDPKRTPRVSVEVARQQIQQYGRDNPWVLVRIFGQFPPASFNALIGPDEITASMSRVYNDYQIGIAALVLGVDVARYGSAASVIFPRRGIQAFTPQLRRGLNSVEGAAWVAAAWNTLTADAAFIDATGGFGAGWIDQLQVLNRSPIGITFSSVATKVERYANKRAEMYFDGVEWIKAGGALPPCPELAAALPLTLYTFTKDGRLILEPKEMVEKKLGYSPDHADAWALTFALPVSPPQKPRPTVSRHTSSYDPFSPDHMGPLGAAVAGSYSPFDPNRR